MPQPFDEDVFLAVIITVVDYCKASSRDILNRRGQRSLLIFFRNLGVYRASFRNSVQRSLAISIVEHP